MCEAKQRLRKPRATASCSKQTVCRNNNVKTVLRLYAGRKMSIVYEGSPYRHAPCHLEPSNLLRNLVHHFRAYLSPPLYLDDKHGAMRLHEKVYLASLAALRAALHIRCSRQNERTLYAEMSQQIPYMVDD